RAFLRGIDRNLIAAAKSLRVIVGENYHDGLNRDSFSQEEYDKVIVSRNNNLCRELGLQYLWSCMVVNGDIVFTTSTSPGKDVTKKDHAGFFEIHRDPRSFDTAFDTMKPDFSSFHNKWGHGRMVLVPYSSADGRPHCFGASMAINDVVRILRGTMVRYAAMFLLVLFVGVAVSMKLSELLSGPLSKIAAFAGRVAHGGMHQKVDAKGSLEAKLLSESINTMYTSIRENIDTLKESEERYRLLSENLEEIVNDRTKELKDKLAELERFRKATIGREIRMKELREELDRLKGRS
ncbi:MAG: methyl-accepting chemotaxis protein, partial [Candidatus Omnitrophota bacterium]